MWKWCATYADEHNKQPWPVHDVETETTPGKQPARAVLERFAAVCEAGAHEGHPLFAMWLKEGDGQQNRLIAYCGTIGGPLMRRGDEYTKCYPLGMMKPGNEPH
jgi:hypothetical protein